MPAVSTVNVLVDNDFIVESSGLYTYQVYYSQHSQSFFAGEFDAYNSALSFNLSGVYGEVFVDVYFATPDSSSIIASKMIFVDYPFDDITEPYAVSNFSLLNPGGDSNDITEGGTISNPAQFDSPDVHITWDTEYPVGHIREGDHVYNDFQLAADYGLDGFSVKILDSLGNYVSDEALNSSESLSNDINRKLESIPITGLIPLSGTEYLYGYADVEAPLTGITGYITGVTNVETVALEEVGVIEELWALTGYSGEIIPAHTGLKQKYKTITGELLQGYTTGDPTYLYETIETETGMLLPDGNALPSGVLEHISGVKVDYEPAVSQLNNNSTYASLVNNGHGVGQSVLLEPGRDISRFSFYKISGEGEDYSEVEYYWGVGTPTGGPPVYSLDDIFHSGKQNISLSEGWKHIYLPQVSLPSGAPHSDPSGREPYSFFLFNASDTELRVAQSADVYSDGEQWVNATLTGDFELRPMGLALSGEYEISGVPFETGITSSGVIGYTGVRAYESSTYLSFSIDYGEVATELITTYTSGIEITGQETGLLPVYTQSSVYVESPLTGIEYISGVVDYLTGVTGYKTICEETGIIGTGVIDYYISPISYIVENITGYLTGCTSEKTIALSGVTGEISGVIQEVLAVTGYETRFSGMEFGGITGYVTGIVGDLYQDVEVPYTEEVRANEKVLLDTIYRYDTGEFAERWLSMQTGTIFESIITGEIIEANVPVFAEYEETIEDGFEIGLIEESENLIPIYAITGYLSGVTGVSYIDVDVTGLIPLIGITGTGLVSSPYVTGLVDTVIGYETGVTGHVQSGLSNAEILSGYNSTKLNLSYASNLEIFGSPSRSLGIEVTPIMNSGIVNSQESVPSTFYLDNEIPSVTYNIIEGEHNQFRLSFNIHEGKGLKVYSMFEDDYMQFADPTEFETGLGSDGLLAATHDNVSTDVIYAPTGGAVDFYVDNTPDNPFYPHYSMVFDGTISPASWELPYNRLALTRLVPEDDFGTGVQNGLYYNQSKPEVIYGENLTGLVRTTVESGVSGVPGSLEIGNITGYITLYDYSGTSTGSIPQYGFYASDPTWPVVTGYFTGWKEVASLSNPGTVSGYLSGVWPLYDPDTELPWVVTGYETGYTGWANIPTGYETGVVSFNEATHLVTGEIANPIGTGMEVFRSDLAPLKIDATIPGVSFEDLNNQKDMKFSWRVTQLETTNQMDHFSGAHPTVEHLNLNTNSSRHLNGFNYGFWDASKYPLYADLLDASINQGEEVKRYAIVGETEKNATLTYSQNINFFPPYGQREVGFYVELVDIFDRVVDQKFSFGYIQPPIITGVVVDNLTPRQITFDYEVVDQFDYNFQAPYGDNITQSSAEIINVPVDPASLTAEELEQIAQIKSGQVIRDKEDKITNLRKIELYSGVSPDFTVSSGSFATKVDGVASNATVYPYLPPRVRSRDYYYKFLTYDHFGSGHLSDSIKATVIGSRAPTGIKPGNITLSE